MKTENTYRAFLLIFLTLGLYSSLYAQNENKTKFEDGILNGRVKSFEQKSFNINKTSQDTVLSSELIYKFNDSGLLEECKGLGQISTYKYNSKNQLIQVNVCRWNGKDCTVNDYSYDEKGNLIKHYSKQPPSTSTITVYFEYFVTYYSYDEQNNLIEEKSFDKPVKAKKEHLEEHKIYEYDPKGNKIIEKELTQSGTFSQKVEYKYSDTTLIETFTWMEFEGEDLYLRDIYEYFESDKIKSKTSIIYAYNSTERIVQKDTTLYIYEFDNENRLIKETENASKIKVKEYHNFDKRNNWQKLIENDNGEVKIIIRQFEYYE
jgi:hypothetical protein